MKPWMLRLARWFRKPPGDPAIGGDPAGRLARTVLEHERAGIRRVDPDTHRQWQVLRNAIGAADMPIRASQSKPRVARVLRPVLVAGILASLAGVVALIAIRDSGPEPLFATHRGQMSSIILPDSSDVVLNHTTQLTVVETEGTRRVRLTGEAYFHVRRNGAPFIVETPGGMVEVLGTEFNVRARGGSFEVAVVSGSVRVRTLHDGGKGVAILTAGMGARSVEGDSALAGWAFAAGSYPPWMHQRLVVQGESLAEVCRELEDRFDVTIRIDAPGVPAERIRGTLDCRDARSAVEALARLTALNVRHDAHAIILH